jgi:hypothetical protein
MSKSKMFSKTKTPSAAEVQRVNQQLEERHYEFVSNCQDGDGTLLQTYLYRICGSIIL